MTVEHPQIPFAPLRLCVRTFPLCVPAPLRDLSGLASTRALRPSFQLVDSAHPRHQRHPRFTFAPSPLRPLRLPVVICWLCLSVSPVVQRWTKLHKTLRILSLLLHRNSTFSRVPPQIAQTKRSNFASPCGTPGNRDNTQKYTRLRVVRGSPDPAHPRRRSPHRSPRLPFSPSSTRRAELLYLKLLNRHP